MYRVVNRSYRGGESVYITRVRADAIDQFIADCALTGDNVRRMIEVGLKTGSYSASSKDRGMVSIRWFK